MSAAGGAADDAAGDATDGAAGDAPGGVLGVEGADEYSVSAASVDEVFGVVDDVAAAVDEPVFPFHPFSSCIHGAMEPPMVVATVSKSFPFRYLMINAIASLTVFGF